MDTVNKQRWRSFRNTNAHLTRCGGWALCNHLIDNGPFQERVAVELQYAAMFAASAVLLEAVDDLFYRLVDKCWHIKVSSLQEADPTVNFLARLIVPHYERVSGLVEKVGRGLVRLSGSARWVSRTKS